MGVVGQSPKRRETPGPWCQSEQLGCSAIDISFLCPNEPCFVSSLPSAHHVASDRALFVGKQSSQSNKQSVLTFSDLVWWNQSSTRICCIFAVQRAPKTYARVQGVSCTPGFSWTDLTL